MKMSESYPQKIKELPLYDGQFDAHKLEAKDSDVLFASYPAGTSSKVRGAQVEKSPFLSKDFKHNGGFI